MVTVVNLRKFCEVEIIKKRDHIAAFRYCSQLPPVDFWHVLSNNFFPHVVQYNQNEIVKLEHIKFCNNARQSEALYVPDIIFKFRVTLQGIGENFSLGYDFIVIVKEGGVQQVNHSSEEWVYLIDNYNQDLINKSEQCDFVYFIAIGGLGGGPDRTVAKIQTEMCSQNKFTKWPMNKRRSVGANFLKV